MRAALCFRSHACRNNVDRQPGWWCRYAPTLSRYVTHLVVATNLGQGSEKLETARKKTASGSWNVIIVNFRWLQQCVYSGRLHATDPYRDPISHHQEEFAAPSQRKQLLPATTVELPSTNTGASAEVEATSCSLATPCARSAIPSAAAGLSHGTASAGVSKPAVRKRPKLFSLHSCTQGAIALEAPSTRSSVLCPLSQ